MKPKFFKTITGQKIPLPVFFPDATRAVIKSLDSKDILNTKTPGILINTFHLSQAPGKSVIKTFKGIRNYMNWNGAAISDSGGFQVMSIAKSDGSKNAVTDAGVRFKLSGKKKVMFTPKDSIDIQMILKSDMVVVLDDFTPPNASKKQAQETVDRTVKWAQICKSHFQKLTKKTDPTKKPYLLGIVQGGFFTDLRKECTERLVEIGFDGLGFGGWPIKDDGTFDYLSAQIIKDNTPPNYLLYGLGIGKPHEIVSLVKNGWHIFDCVLPTRDARHRRLYVYNADSINHIDINQSDFYQYYTPDKEKYYKDQSPVSTACDCQLCQNYSKSYLAHLFRIGDMPAGRLATIHNLRFYSILMEKLRNNK